jgi:hypothetical protein
MTTTKRLTAEGLRKLIREEMGKMDETSHGLDISADDVMAMRGSDKSFNESSGGLDISADQVMQMRAEGKVRRSK